MRVHHVALQAPDLDAARAFYVGVLGFRLVREQGHSFWVDADGVIIMIERCTGPVVDEAWSSDRPGPFVLAFSIEPQERARWLERLASASVVVDHTSAFSVYFRDPFGSRLAFSHFPAPCE